VSLDIPDALNCSHRTAIYFSDHGYLKGLFIPVKSKHSCLDNIWMIECYQRIILLHFGVPPFVIMLSYSRFKSMKIWK